METLEEKPAEQAEETEDKEAVDTPESQERQEAEDQDQQPEAEGETPEQTEESGDKSGQPASESESEEEGELVIEIEGDSPDPEEEKERREAPQWVKDTRKENRELNKKLKQREKEIEELRNQISPKPEIPPEPELYDDGIDGDPKKLIAAVRQRDKLIAEAEASKKAERELQQAEQAKVKERLDLYSERKATFASKVRDYEEHVTEAEDTLSEFQRDAIAYYFKDNAAEIMYAIGKDSRRLEKLAGISDPTEMLLAVKEIQQSMKISTRKPSTKPETVVEGQTKIKNSEAYLEKLEEEADRTGDRSKITAYKRELREKARASRK